MNWRASSRRLLPYALVASGGFLLAYLVVAFLVFPPQIVPDDVKVQAIRALATWEAVEVMPRLIELTTSGSKPVATAAREALERLNAPK